LKNLVIGIVTSQKWNYIFTIELGPMKLLHHGGYGVSENGDPQNHDGNGFQY
jgi:hypothetical protein